MYYVYLIRSEKNPKEKYIGYTSNLKARLKAHNRGHSVYTKDHCPWRLETYLAFQNRSSAIQFEKYLKTGSGHAFAKRRLWLCEHLFNKHSMDPKK